MFGIRIMLIRRWVSIMRGCGVEEGSSWRVFAKPIGQSFLFHTEQLGFERYLLVSQLPFNSSLLFIDKTSITPP